MTEIVSSFNVWIIKLIAQSAKEQVLTRAPKKIALGLWPSLVVPGDWRSEYDLVIWDTNAATVEIMLIMGNPYHDHRLRGGTVCMYSRPGPGPNPGPGPESGNLCQTPVMAAPHLAPGQSSKEEEEYND